MKKNIMFVGNWKMTPKSQSEASKLYIEIKKSAKKYKVETVICPPAVFLGLMSKSIQKGVALGAQNVSTEKAGAFTGEISASMLKDFKVSYCIVGHSERRKMSETSEMVSKKAVMLLENKITPIICVGENERDSEGLFYEHLKKELLESIKGVAKNAMAKIVVAYEPLWAISTAGNGAMSPKDIEETVIFIRKVLADAFGKNIASKVKILYGGSVSGSDIKDILNLGNCDGVLVGKASQSKEGILEMFKSI